MERTIPRKTVKTQQQKECALDTKIKKQPTAKDKHDVSPTKGHKPINTYRKEINPDSLKQAKLLVEKAIKEKKVFAIQGYYPYIRSGLKSRGWVEKNIHKVRRQHDDDTEGICDLMSRLLHDQDPNFVWASTHDSLNRHVLKNDQIIINHFPKSVFTTKVGLCLNLRNLHWFADADPNSFSPRCYRLGVKEEKQAFIEDFRLTAACSILKLVSREGKNMPNRRDVKKEITAALLLKYYKKAKPLITSVPVQVIKTALKACKQYLNTLEHKDIDWKLGSTNTITEDQWKEFLHGYYQVIHEDVIINEAENYVSQCQDILQKLKAVNPQLDIEGERNIWIVKPGASSRGRGITCIDHLEEALKFVDCDPLLISDGKLVVQKYIERPLLIYGTKFDVRQWFVVTNWNPLTIWYYKECYLRFSSQPFSLKNLHSSIHLCNHSIQKYCKISQSRHPQLPEENMWFKNQFQDYLQMIGATNAWKEIIEPGMKAAIIHTLQCSQDKVVGRKNCFQFYGADFMFGENFQPWLIEINACPAMSLSTSVNSKLCIRVQEDILRLILDRKQDADAYVGAFELIYKQPAIKIPQHDSKQLLVKGTAIKKTLQTSPFMTNEKNQTSSGSIAKGERNPCLLNRAKTTATWKEIKGGRETSPSKKVEVTVLPTVKQGLEKRKVINQYQLPKLCAHEKTITRKDPARTKKEAFGPKKLLNVDSGPLQVIGQLAKKPASLTSSLCKGPSSLAYQMCTSGKTNKIMRIDK
ncbi:tubulin monoglycylase TTLL3 [Xenopus tropicalis]|uniref:Tubulin monoglycylase TTLL3 n=1 Tax=Xenopus tropicalis TaxID=8364 RepID=A0A8J0QU11_XENTR|nr:tubulin monoglycylase TTLL3 [Xenopus tropicalis]